MRWIVDVNSLDASKSAQNYCVEAESWQGALQSARRLRGDESRMAGFSIDITNDGCRAVDPSKKLRYDVTRAVDGTPLTPGGETPPPKRRSSQPPKVETRSADVPRPSAPAPAVAATPSVKPSALPRPTPPTTSAPPAAIAPLPSVVIAPAAVAPVAVAAPVVPVAVAPVAVAAPVAAPRVVLPPIVIKREQEATAEVPLTYREYGFALPTGTTEEAAAAELRRILVHVQDAIATAPTGRLVNLAAFDQLFQGRPPVLPLATLTWKDWKPEPAIAFPRRARAVVVVQPAVASVQVQPAPVPVQVPPAPVAAQAQPAQPAPIQATPSVIVAPDVAFPPVSQTRPAAPKPVSTPPAQKPPVPKRRVRGDELISVLFESMHDLHFLRDSIEGGDFCVQLALEKLPSRLGIVYLYDIDRREFVIVSANGQAPQGIMGKRFAETEPLLSAAMRKRRAIVLAGGDPAMADHASTFGGARDLLLAPVMQAGRFLGAIEIADPTDSVPFSELDANAITYMAEQYAEFVAARGVLLDRERSSQPPAARTQ